MLAGCCSRQHVADTLCVSQRLQHHFLKIQITNVHNSRRWAVLKKDKADNFNADEPKWLHKENYECVFTAGTV